MGVVLSEAILVLRSWWAVARGHMAGGLARRAGVQRRHARGRWARGDGEPRGWSDMLLPRGRGPGALASPARPTAARRRSLGTSVAASAGGLLRALVARAMVARAWGPAPPAAPGSHRCAPTTPRRLLLAHEALCSGGSGARLRHVSTSLPYCLAMAAIRSRSGGSVVGGGRVRLRAGALVARTKPSKPPGVKRNSRRAPASPTV